MAGVSELTRDQKMAYREHELVVLTRHLPAHGLIAGDAGTVVGVYGNGGYEVEFTTGDGHTLAVATLAEADLRRCADREILHVRRVT
ncbi:DUF4926 domain-containing protein [Mycolicibacterium doricum]|nr:DUF4926 domain-containing protein [Mycolicibacterium doricum]